jgi:hypothetical protein
MIRSHIILTIFTDVQVPIGGIAFGIDVFCHQRMISKFSFKFSNIVMQHRLNISSLLRLLWLYTSTRKIYRTMLQSVCRDKYIEMFYCCVISSGR